VTLTAYPQRRNPPPHDRGGFAILPELDGLIVAGQDVLDDALHHQAGSVEGIAGQTMVPLMQALQGRALREARQVLFSAPGSTWSTEPDAYAMIDAAVEPHPLLTIA